MPSSHSHFSVLTFNLLAPCYKRLFSPSGKELHDRERDHSHLWNARLDAILNLLKSISPPPDIIALQEVWFHFPFLARLKQALSHHYHVFLAQRPFPKHDGLATLVRKNHPFLSQPIHLTTFPLSNSDRVALAVRLTLTRTASNPSEATLLVINTHLTFPHDQILRRERNKQVQDLTSFVSSYVSSHSGRVSTIVMGDFNSDMHSTVCNRMLDAHFLNCYTSLNGPAAYPTTHYNHKRQQVFVDHVFLRNDPSPPPIFSADLTTKIRSSRRPKRPTSRARSSSPSTVGRTDVFDQKGQVSQASQLHRPTEPLPVSLHVLHMRPVASVVYPKELPIERWPPGFQVSDHRPVGISFSIESYSTEDN